MGPRRVSFAVAASALLLTAALTACGGGGSHTASTKSSSSPSGAGSGSASGSLSSAFCDDLKTMNDSSRDPGVDNFITTDHTSAGALDANPALVNQDARWFAKIVGEAPDAVKGDLQTMQMFNTMIANNVPVAQVQAAYDNASAAADRVRSFIESDADTCSWASADSASGDTGTTNPETTDSLTAFCNDLSAFQGEYGTVLPGVGALGGPSASQVSQMVSAMQHLADEAPATVASSGGTLSPMQDAEAVVNDLKSLNQHQSLDVDYSKLDVDQQGCPGGTNYLPNSGSAGTGRSDINNSPSPSDAGVSPGVTCPTDSAGNCIGNSP